MVDAHGKIRAKGSTLNIHDHSQNTLRLTVIILWEARRVAHFEAVSTIHHHFISSSSQT